MWTKELQVELVRLELAWWLDGDELALRAIGDLFREVTNDELAEVFVDCMRRVRSEPGYADGSALNLELWKIAGRPR
jgi:hypothetical protein